MSTPPPPLPFNPKLVKKWTPPPPPRPVPAKNAYPLPVQEFSWMYWFNYFYNEVPTHRQREFYEVISPTQDKYVASDNVLSVIAKKKLLKDMMDLGFVAFPDLSRLGADAMFATMKSMGAPEPMRVMFRGDGRTPAEIQAHGGTKPQTIVRLANRNFNKEWHPWRDQALANKVWYRKGFNGDNCLFSAISVTPDFTIATKFPLLKDLQATNPAAVKQITVKLVAGSVQKTNGSVAALRMMFDTQRKLLCSQSNIYVVKVKGGYDTKAMQLKSHNATFDERAYDKLSYAQHYAVLKVTRVHYTDDPNDGHVILVRDTQKLQSDVHLKASLGETGAVELEKFLKTMKKDGNPDYGGIHYHPNALPAPFRIESFGALPALL